MKIKKISQQLLKSFIMLFLLTTLVLLFTHREIKKLSHQYSKLLQEQLGAPILHDQIALKLKTYAAEDRNGPIKLIRLGKNNDGGYLAPITALEASEFLVGYGIADDASFEENFSRKFNKPSYGFDCGVNYRSKTIGFTFIKECIASDKTLYSKNRSNKKLSTFEKQLIALGLQNRPIFIKMDIEGSEYSAFESIYGHFNQITGIVLEIHLFDLGMKERSIELLEKLNANFVLLNVHGNNFGLASGFYSKYAEGKLPSAIELTYINKNLVKSYHLAPRLQSHPSLLDMPNNAMMADAKFKILG